MALGHHWIFIRRGECARRANRSSDPPRWACRQWACVKREPELASSFGQRLAADLLAQSGDRLTAHRRDTSARPGVFGVDLPVELCSDPVELTTVFHDGDLQETDVALDAIEATAHFRA